MKISIKTLQGKPTELEVAETDTLADIKKKISEQMTVDPTSQKLIHYGKVMTDDNKKLAEYGVKDKDFLVLMITKVDFLAIQSNRKSHLRKRHLHPSPKSRHPLKPGLLSLLQLPVPQKFQSQPQLPLQLPLHQHVQVRVS